ncbi:amino acid transporter [Penicillium argentinense]|uniref:Amino acid transporter n=1 Tax=Penicillium argentinense TaxID=1131581 RepID=A0A9W9FG48_9EURO|nr:amino acid transporter [Penicillium argentinense]KAJ5099521.1 amino acid transporter [Penicillium argentinense]
MGQKKLEAGPQPDEVQISDSEEIHMNLIALSFNTSDSWVGIGSNIPLVLAARGRVSLLYGTIVISFTITCTGVSLAELASVYPTEGGQYHLSSIIAPKRHSKWISYFCGLPGVFSWIAIAASIGLIVTEFVFSLTISYNPDLQTKRWQYFLLYQAVQLIGFFSIALFIVVSIICPVRSSSRPDTSQVWMRFINSSGGWSNGISFLTELSTPSYMLIGIDATMHLAEECLEPTRIIPKAIMSTGIAGIITVFEFSVGMCYSQSNASSLLESPIP